MTVPFVMFSAYSTPFEFQHTLELAAHTRFFVSPTLLPLVPSSGLPGDCIYIFEGHVQGRPSLTTSLHRHGQTGYPVCRSNRPKPIHWPISCFPAESADFQKVRHSGLATAMDSLVPLIRQPS